MAAGIGSRYGGLKQIDPIGPSGEIVVDYSIYDALQAGFGRVVFLIRREIEAAFREKMAPTVEKKIDVTYVFQELSCLPPGFRPPDGRKKPWGTGHALLSCKDVVHTPCAVINADDFYGRGAFLALAGYLRNARDFNHTGDYCMVGYVLKNTLSEQGHVARGVCEITLDGFLKDIHERTQIVGREDGVFFTENGIDWTPISGESIVSLNSWGFTPSIFDALEEKFPAFLRKNKSNLLKAEYFLPEVVGVLIKENRARVKVLPSQENWFGVTYPEDRPRVQAAIRELIAKGMYPANLWET